MTLIKCLSGKSRSLTKKKMFKHSFVIKIHWRLTLRRKVFDIRKCSDLDPRSVLPVHSSNGRPTRCFATSSALVCTMFIKTKL